MQNLREIRQRAAFTRWGNIAPIRRFLSYVQLDIHRGCWLWLGSLNLHGYGQFYDRTKERSVHAFRWAYEFFKGPLPKGKEPDHLCRVRSCVNPEHLEAVTPKENKRRGVSPAANNARKTECIHGHNEWSSAGKRGGRRCLACHRENEQLRKQLLRDAGYSLIEVMCFFAIAGLMILVIVALAATSRQIIENLQSVDRCIQALLECVSI